MSVSVLDIGVSEDVNDISSQEPRSSSICDAARTPLSDDRPNNDSLNAVNSADGLVLEHQNDARLIIGSQSDVA